MKAEAFWEAILAQDAERIRCYFHEDAHIRWHCTNECFTVEEFVRANCAYPGQWEGELERIIEGKDLLVTVAHVYAKDRLLSFHATSFIRLSGDKITALDEYWAEDGEAPQWRKDMHIGRPVGSAAEKDILQER